KRILAFHVSDWLMPTTDLVNDRGMPGDGVINIPSIRRLVENAGFNGAIELEIFSPYWWQKDINSTGNDSNLLIVFYVQIMPDDLVMQLHRF
ncbi:TIM barrel protein, partial [Salmonella enterica]